MNEIVAKSDDSLAVQKQAVDLKGRNGASKDIQGLEIDCMTLASDRDADAKRLFDVLSKDLENNRGESGIFFSAYIRHLGAMTSADRALLSDVKDDLQTFVRGKIAHESNDAAYKTRLDELNKF